MRTNVLLYKTLTSNAQKSARTFIRNEIKGIIITMYITITRYKYKLTSMRIKHECRICIYKIQI